MRLLALSLALCWFIMGEVGTAVMAEPGVYYVSGNVYDNAEPFDGLYTTTPEGANAYISRITADGDRLSWLVETAVWNESEYLAADDTGVYVLYETGTGYHLRKFDPDGAVLWSFSFGEGEGASYPESFHLKDGFIVACGWGSDAFGIDATTGAQLWAVVNPGDGECIHGPLVGGLPTLYTSKWDGGAGAQRLNWVGAAGTLGSWLLSGSYMVLLPTDDPTVAYGWDSIGAVPEQVWRLSNLSLGQPVETYTGTTVVDQTAFGMSLDPETLGLFGHSPYNWSVNPVTVRAYSLGSSTAVWSDSTSGVVDYNGIYTRDRAHDGLYMQVYYLYDSGNPPYGVMVKVFDQETGDLVFGPYSFGDDESGGFLHGAFAGSSLFSVATGKGS